MDRRRLFVFSLLVMALASALVLVGPLGGAQAQPPGAVCIELHGMTPHPAGTAEVFMNEQIALGRMNFVSTQQAFCAW